MDKSYSRYNVVATYGSGKIGNARLYKKGDRSYVRAAYNGAITNPRTEKQMRNRLKWANLGVAWQYLKPHLEKGFEGQKPYRSAFNMWMRANMELGLGVFLEKERTSGRICPLQPFMLTKGSIVAKESVILQPEITTAGSGESAVELAIVNEIYCSINTTAEDEGEEKPTIGAVSANLLEHNGWLKAGDMITVVLMLDNGTATSSPRPLVIYEQVVIDPEDTNEWSMDFLNHTSILPSQVMHSEALPTAQKWAYGVIVTRKESGDLQTTTSQMVLSTAAETKKQTFLTRQQFVNASESYGPVSYVFLDPKKPTTQP